MILNSKLDKQVKGVSGVIALLYADEIAAVREGRVKGVKQQLEEYALNNPHRAPEKINLREWLNVMYDLNRKRQAGQKQELERSDALRRN